MKPSTAYLLSVRDSFLSLGWSVAARRVESAIIEGLFEDLMDREGMEEML